MRIGNHKLKKLGEYLKAESASIQNKEKVNIFFENNDEEWLCLMLGKFITAKGMRDKTWGKVSAIKRKADKEYGKICDFFGFDTLYLEDHIRMTDKCAGYFMAAIFWLFRNSGKEMLKLHYKKVHIGDLIYDYLIRTGRNVYTIEKISTKEQFQTLAEGYMWVRIYDRLFRNVHPDYYIAGDVIYLNGIIVRAAQKYHAQIFEFCTGKYSYKIETKKNCDYSPNYHFTSYQRIRDYINNQLEPDWKEQAEKRLADLFAGVGDWNTREAYLHKKTAAKQEILEDIGIHNNKKNILIMAHCFSDSPHCGGGFIYKDYYEWLEETLKFVRTLDHVNWILKAHPCRDFYGEKDVVENMFIKYKSPALFWMPDTYSSAMVPVIADGLITVGGTGGIEYSCCGIPSVNAGNAFYTPFGFTVNVGSVQEYHKVLRNMHRIRRLDSEKIEKAKQVYYCYWRLTGFSGDSLQMLFNRYYFKY